MSEVKMTAAYCDVCGSDDFNLYAMGENLKPNEKHCAKCELETENEKLKAENEKLKDSLKTRIAEVEVHFAFLEENNLNDLFNSWLEGLK